MPKEAFKEHLELTTIIGCKGGCKYCPQDIFLKRYFEIDNIEYKPMELTLENCKKYIQSVPKTLRISLAGFSEPLVATEIVDIYKFLINDGRNVDVNTTLYNVSIKTIKDIFDIGVSYINLHLPDKNNYTNIRLDEEYIKKLRLTLSFIKNSNTYAVVTCLGDMPEQIMEIINRYDINMPLNIGKIYINDRAGIVNNGIPYKSQYYKGKVRCCKTIDSLNYTVLLPDGNIVLCCMDFGLSNILGNLNKNTYNEILNGEKANEIRRNMDIEGANLICRHCEFAVEI